MEQYFYEGTDVLKNSFNLRDKDDLRFAENFWVEMKLAELFMGGEKLEEINYVNYINLHKYLFEGIYSWAGQERKMQIQRKDGILYSDLKDIKANAEEIIHKLRGLSSYCSKEIATSVYAKSITGLWKNHSFINGNLITTMTFIKMAAIKKGITIDLSKVKHGPSIRAAVEADIRGESKLIRNIIGQSMKIEHVRE